MSFDAKNFGSERFEDAVKPAYVEPKLTPLGSVQDFVLAGTGGDGDAAPDGALGVAS